MGRFCACFAIFRHRKNIGKVQECMNILREFVLRNLVIVYFNRNIAIKLMGLTKKESFTVRDNRIARYAKALGHPARIAIMRILLKQQSCVCGDIVEELPLSQSTVSQHLKELKEAGLIKGDIEGVKVCYCVDVKEWEQARQQLQSLLALKPPANSCC